MIYILYEINYFAFTLDFLQYRLYQFYGHNQRKRELINNQLNYLIFIHRLYPFFRLVIFI